MLSRCAFSSRVLTVAFLAYHLWSYASIGEMEELICLWHYPTYFLLKRISACRTKKSHLWIFEIGKIECDSFEIGKIVILVVLSQKMVSTYLPPKIWCLPTYPNRNSKFCCGSVKIHYFYILIGRPLSNNPEDADSFHGKIWLSFILAVGLYSFKYNRGLSSGIAFCTSNRRPDH